MNRILIVVLALLAFAPAATGESSPPKSVDDHPIWRHLDDRAALDRLTEEDKLLGERLRKKTVSLWCKDMKPHDLVVLLEKVLDEPVRILFNTLNNAGVSHDTTITYMPHVMPAAFALDLFVDSYNEHAVRPLAWTIKEGQIVIGLTSQFRAPTNLIVYDIRDLLHDMDADARTKRVDEIIASIQDNVDPDGWRDLGGEVGSVQNLNGNLIITNTPTNHREIQTYLAEVRRLSLIQIDVRASILRVPAPLNELDLGLPALKVPADGNAIAIAGNDAADAAIEKLVAEGGEILFSPRLLVQSGNAATMTIDGGEMITLPISGEADAAVPVRILNGAAASVTATADEANKNITLNLAARVTNVERNADEPRQRIAAREINLDLADGDVVFIELPTTLYRLLSVRRTTNPMTDAQTLEVIREAIEMEPTDTILLMLRATIVVPEEHEDLLNID